MRIRGLGFARRQYARGKSLVELARLRLTGLKPGLDLRRDLNDSGFGNHRAGWEFALSSLSGMHNPAAVDLVSFMEKTFVWNPGARVHIVKPWVGVTHRPQNVPRWFPPNMQTLPIETKEFARVAGLCQGIFTLSKYHADHLRSRLQMPVESLVHPTEFPGRLWSPGALNGGSFPVVQVGWWLRNLHAIFLLPEGGYRKVYLTKRHLEPVDEIFVLEQRHLRKRGVDLERAYETAETVDYLPDDEYDELLCSGVVLIELYDASANNAIIEAMARGTPILVNPLPPVREYLGDTYPLYFESLEEAAAKLGDHGLIRQAHEHIMASEIRPKLQVDYFVESVRASSIYRSLLEKMEQGQLRLFA